MSVTLHVVHHEDHAVPLGQRRDGFAESGFQVRFGLRPCLRGGQPVNQIGLALAQPPDLAHAVERNADRDRVQPGRQCSLSAKLDQASERTEESLLRKVLREVCVAPCQATGETKDAVDVRVVQLALGRGVTREYASDQVFFQAAAPGGFYSSLVSDVWDTWSRRTVAWVERDGHASNPLSFLSGRIRAAASGGVGVLTRPYCYSMPTGKNGRRRSAADDHQLSLSLAWLSEEEFARALHVRGAVAIRRVRFKRNRTRMVSLSADRLSLNIHQCFRGATQDVLDAVAAFIRQPSHSVSYRSAIRRMREWWDGQIHLDDHGANGNGLRPRTCCATAEQRGFLDRTYGVLNHTRFNGCLPERIPIRLSNRMARRFGHVYYGTSRDGARLIEEIAINIDLMMEGNERHLLDTLLHEMSHAEAWLLHGHKDHGPVWRGIAERVGCEAKACSVVRIRRRRGAKTPITRVPRLAFSKKENGSHRSSSHLA